MAKIHTSHYKECLCLVGWNLLVGILLLWGVVSTHVFLPIGLSLLAVPNFFNGPESSLEGPSDQIHTCGAESDMLLASNSRSCQACILL